MKKYLLSFISQLPARNASQRDAGGSSPKGFTLIELLVVIAILGVMAGGVLVAINPLRRIKQANDARIKSDMGQITNAMQAYFTTHQYYPADVACLVASGDLKTVPKKPDGTPYTIECTSQVTALDCNAGGCTEASIVTSLNDPQNPYGTWTWSSSTSQASEIAPPTPTPTPTTPPTPTNTPPPTPTITPTPLPPIVLSDDNQTGFWSAAGDQNPGGDKIWAIAGLTNPTITGTVNTNSLKIAIATGISDLSHPYLAHDYGSSRASWSGYNTVSFHWFGGGTGATLSFMIQTGPDYNDGPPRRGPWEEASYCNFSDGSPGWQTVTIPFSTCDKVGGGANLTRINRIFLGSNVGLPTDTPSSFTWYLDRVVVSQ